MICIIFLTRKTDPGRDIVALVLEADNTNYFSNYLVYISKVGNYPLVNALSTTSGPKYQVVS